MHPKDLYCGIALIVLGGSIVWEASGFPALAGMPYGAGLFPTIAALGMCLCGALIVISALIRKRQATVLGDKELEKRTRYRGTFNSIAVIVVVILYALFLDSLGFHVVSFLALLSLLLILQVRWMISFILAISVSVGVHFIFYSMLHVPLPWGMMERLPGKFICFLKSL